MSLLTVQAHFACDFCGTPFSVEVANDAKMPTGWTMWELAVDSVRGDARTSVENKADDHEQVYCQACTTKRDWTCDNCGEEREVGDLEEVGTRWVCPDCRH